MSRKKSAEPVSRSPPVSAAVLSVGGATSAYSFAAVRNATSQAAVALTFSDGTQFTDAADSATLDWFPLSSLLSFSSADPSVVEIDGVGTL